MDKQSICSLALNAKKYLSEEELPLFIKQLKEIYYQHELDGLIQGMPIDKEPEPWRSDKMFNINQQLASLY